MFWPDDLNPANNLGQENVDVGKLNSPMAVFKFPLRNDAPIRRRLRLEVDAYPPPAPPPCPPRPEDHGQGGRSAERRSGAAVWRPIGARPTRCLRGGR
jgi:hypothetical protein